ncbi:hypothetical protein TIFTF001_006954 [Ficus carica]|uniref:Uncharacterized protein n=1 Tax=Ficus carica TaxID=3494 RepID=A0AA87ZQ35_FICCA|nr:hypothetical protein TIFTF001_006954 [Ficus carica]
MYNSAPDQYPQEKYAADNPSPGIIGNPNIAQPYHAAYIQRPPTVPSAAGRWSSGLCHCCDDPANCIVTCCCPCITFGQIAEIVDKGSPSCGSSGTIYGLLLAFTGLSCLYSCIYRSKLRGQLDLEESPCVDCLVHFCCETCALCQEYRELKNRGLDMGIGWEANLRRQQYGVTAAPTVAPPMTR